LQTLSSFPEKELEPANLVKRPFVGVFIQQSGECFSVGLSELCSSFFNQSFGEFILKIVGLSPISINLRFISKPFHFQVKNSYFLEQLVLPQLF